MTLAQEVYAPVDVAPGSREELHCMLQFRRPHNSIGEHSFNETFLFPLSPVAYMDDAPTPVALAYGLTVPNADGSASTTLFSCHVDTVHHDSYMQTVQYDPGLELFYKTDGAPLGADDGAGVWLLLCMYRAGVPGSYVFHRGEEKGGIGSSGMAKHHSEWLAQHTHAIAFDRKGETSIITHQRWGDKGCSNAFADELASRLNASGVLRYEADDSGVFTDTANYFDLISECTNLSVGYDAEHTSRETQDWNFLAALHDVVIKPETWVNLPALREPGDTYDSSRARTWGMANYPSWGDLDDLPPLRAVPLSAANEPEFDAYEALERLRHEGWAKLRQFADKATPFEMAMLLAVTFDELNFYDPDSEEDE